ncbi:uncharacterized protein LOC144153306 [Haemaphysalis longicornis]
MQAKMNVLVMILAVISLSGANKPKEKGLRFCDLKEASQHWVIQCLWPRVDYEAQVLIASLMRTQNWGLPELSKGLCTPHGIFTVRLHFRKKRDWQKLLMTIREAVVCMKYLAKYTATGRE